MDTELFTNRNDGNGSPTGFDTASDVETEYTGGTSGSGHSNGYEETYSSGGTHSTENKSASLLDETEDYGNYGTAADLSYFPEEKDFSNIAQVSQSEEDKKKKLSISDKQLQKALEPFAEKVKENNAHNREKEEKDYTLREGGDSLPGDWTIFQYKDPETGAVRITGGKFTDQMLNAIKESKVTDENGNTADDYFKAIAERLNKGQREGTLRTWHTENGKWVEGRNKHLQETIDKVLGINTDVNTVEEFDATQLDLAKYTKNYMNIVREDLSLMVNDLTKQGKSIQDLRDSSQFKDYSTDIFATAQSIKQKCNELRTKATQLGYQKETGLANDIKNTAIRTFEAVDDVFNEKGKNWNITDKLTNNEAYAITEFLNDIDCTEAAAEALMKSAAFNGAKDVKGSEYVENWKNEKSYKPTTKDIVSTAARGGLGILSIASGIALCSNPATMIAGIALIASGSISAGKGIGQGAAKFGLSQISNKQQMFGTGNKAADIAIDVYNRGFEPANYGDPKSVGTYTENIGTGLSLANALMNVMTNPLEATNQIAQAITGFKGLRQGGAAGIDTMNENIYSLLSDYDKFNNTEFAKKYMEDPEYALTSYTEGEQTGGNFGVETGDLEGDDKYSGYVEQAKDSNIAEDYNRGLEKEVRDAVSDKYCKIFRTMLEKEPEYIRKVLIAIPKNHFEGEIL